MAALLAPWQPTPHPWTSNPQTAFVEVRLVWLVAAHSKQCQTTLAMLALNHARSSSSRANALCGPMPLRQSGFPFGLRLIDPMPIMGPSHVPVSIGTAELSVNELDSIWFCGGSPHLILKIRLCGSPNLPALQLLNAQQDWSRI